MWQQFEETAQQLEESHRAQLEAIESKYRNTTVGALMANFELLRLSPEVMQLDAYRVLDAKKRQFDEYVLRHGFDRQAARALVEVRSELDNLTRAVQERRRRARG
jgi:hypothetical protein